MVEISLREVKEKDFKDIYELNKDLGYEYPMERVKGRINYILENTKDMIIIAESDGEVVGYIHGSPYELMYSDSLVNVLGFVVKVKVRSNGVGNMLIGRLEEWAKNNGYAGIRLVSGHDRLGAHRFYENHGYINRKNQKNFVKTL